MDYEKKYKEALERADALTEKYGGRTFAEYIFPELTESEDERMMRVIGLALTDVPEERFTSLETTLKDCLAWLEKQKEQKPLMCDGEIEDRKRDIVAAIRKFYPADYAEYLTSFLKGLSPEDNSEDEYGQEMLGIAYKLMYENIPKNLRTKEFWDSLKFMREYTGKVAIIHSYEQPAEWSDTDMKEARNNLISVCRDWERGEQTTLLPVVAVRARYFLEHLTEPKPAEWGEEDERKRNGLIKGLEDRMGFGWASDPFSREEYIAWLKSLRPQQKKELSVEKAIQWLDDTFYFLDNSSGRGRDCEITTHDFDSLEEMYDSFRKAVIVDSQPSWKPSEEQMKALNTLNCRGDLSYVGQQNQLISLYQQLKKLL